MAKYAISEEGIAQLQKLSKNIIRDTEIIYEAGISLKNNISSLGEELGIYEDEILTIVNQNQTTLQTNRDTFKQLSDSIAQKADEIFGLIELNGVGLNGLENANASYKASHNHIISITSDSNVDLDQLSDQLINLYSSKYGNYISYDKLNKPLDKTVRYISQLTMKLRTKQDGILGYNNGKKSYIAKGTGHELQTTVHENLHQLSNNNGKAGITTQRVYGYGRNNIQMNEAITELLTKRTLGERYGSDYSLYSNNRDAMAILESSLGENLVAEAYFQNKPELLEQKIDSVLGPGHWEQLSEAFDDCVDRDYNTRESGKIRRDNIIDQFMRATNFVKEGDNEWIEILL